MSIRRNIMAAGAATLLSVSAATVAGPTKTSLPRLPLPTGRVTYAVHHPLMNGSSSITWMENGRKFRQEALLRVQQPGAHGPSFTDITSTVFSDGKYVYLHNPDLGKQFRRMPLTGKGVGALAGSVPLSVDPKATKLVGKGQVLGKPCEIREAQHLRMWSWKGLPLKMEPAPGAVREGGFAGLLSTLRIQATKIEPGIKPAASLFKVPAGYKVVDAKVPTRVPGALPK